MADWQPIDTAPTDGTPILAVVVTDGRYVDVNVAVWSARYHAWAVDHGPLGPHLMQPTHWLPLPRIPADTPGCDCGEDGNPDFGYHAHDCEWRVRHIESVIVNKTQDTPS